MARCRCLEVECACRITNGTGIDIVGDGTAATPWTISATPQSTDTIEVANTPTLDLILNGQGTPIAPYVLSGFSHIGPLLTVEDTATVDLELTGAGNTTSPLLLRADVGFVDLSAPGATGDVLTKRADGRYIPAPVSAAPGTVFATGGVGGSGTFADPLHISPTIFANMAALDASTQPVGSLAGVTGIGVFTKGTDGVWRATDGPAGTLRPTINATADVGWALMDGQTLVGAETTFPRLWAMAPAAWKAGANLTLPNMANRVAMGIGTTGLGFAAGANQATLSAAQMPNHAHSIDHDHPAVSTGFVSNDHSHPVNIQSGGASAQHVHNLAGGGPPFTNAAQQAGAIIAGTADGFTGPEQSDHSHAVNGNTGGISANHTHGVDIPYYSGNSGGAGGGQQLSLVQSHLAVQWQIRTY